MELKTCANPNCRKEFEPDKYNSDRQLFCSDPACKSYRKVMASKRWKANHKEETAAYFKAWRKKNIKRVLRVKKEHRDKSAVKLAHYKYSASARGHEWTLTDPQAIGLFSKPCYWCGDPGYGIDRFDNSQGYTAENSVPCCKLCNRMKGAMSPEDFTAQTMKIARHTVGVVELFLSRKDVSSVQS